MTTQQLGNSSAGVCSENSVNTAVSMLVSIIETACEHESDLELMRLVNFMDLYRTYLSHAKIASAAGQFSTINNTIEPTEKLENTDHVNFEHFISDSRLLKFAADTVSRECGVTVAVPPPLKLSANSNFI